MNDGFGQAPKKKETVYSGPTPGMDNKAFTMASVPGASGTVYNGPTPGGTVYGGPSPAPAAAGTVFDEGKFVAKKPDASVAIKATTTRVRWATLRFFVVAAISLIEAIYYGSDRPILSIYDGIVFVVFLTIGIFAFRLSRVAFLVGMSIYVMGTLLLIFLAIMIDGGFILFIYDIAIHILIVYRLWVAYGHLEELHSLAD